MATRSGYTAWATRCDKILTIDDQRYGGTLIKRGTRINETPSIMVPCKNK